MGCLIVQSVSWSGMKKKHVCHQILNSFRSSRSDVDAHSLASPTQSHCWTTEPDNRLGCAKNFSRNKENSWRTTSSDNIQRVSSADIRETNGKNSREIIH